MPGTAVITGASAGVGRATACAFADAGWDLALLARGADGLAGAAADVEARGRKAVTYQVDLTDWEAVRIAAREAEAHLGPVDVWVNNAMSTIFSPIRDIDVEAFHRAVDVTFFGQVHGTLAALELMRPRDRGTIVSVGSALAFRAIPLQAPYCASKFATRGFMESLRTELLHEGSGIRVTQVHLPAVNTPQFAWCRNNLDDHPMPVPPIYSPDVPAKAILEAATEAPREKVVGSWNRMLVLVNKVMPGVLDHFAARSAWEGQQVPGTRAPDTDNLYEPIDDRPGTDRGASGRFGDQDGGVADPAFLKTLPRTIATVGHAVAARVREVRGADDPDAVGPGDAR